jgi:hypothetical protein
MEVRPPIVVIDNRRPYVGNSSLQSFDPTHLSSYFEYIQTTYYKGSGLTNIKDCLDGTNLEKRQLIAILGGDATFREVAKGLLRPSVFMSYGGQLPPVVLLGGGSTNTLQKDTYYRGQQVFSNTGLTELSTHLGIDYDFRETDYRPLVYSFQRMPQALAAYLLGFAHIPNTVAAMDEESRRTAVAQGLSKKDLAKIYRQHVTQTAFNTANSPNSPFVEFHKAGKVEGFGPGTQWLALAALGIRWFGDFQLPISDSNYDPKQLIVFYLKGDGKERRLLVPRMIALGVLARIPYFGVWLGLRTGVAQVKQMDELLVKPDQNHPLALCGDGDNIPIKEYLKHKDITVGRSEFPITIYSRKP